MDVLTENILDELENFQIENSGKKEIFQANIKKSGNEFLFILKPEVLYKTSLDQVRSVLQLLFKRFKKYGIQINNIHLFNSEYLNKNNVIANHYGIINAAARDVNTHISNEAIENFVKIYNKEYTEANVYGAIELLHSELGINNETLAEMWNSYTIKRLAGGIYSVQVNFKGKDLYIINGFHPPQLNHFIEDGRTIITMNLSGEVDWKVARQEMIGNTYPKKAKKGTIRRDLFDLFGNYGFENVSYVINSVHLSAGPLEGLIELTRFNSSNTPKEHLFGQLLTDNFSPNIVNHILTNPVVKFKNKEVSLFDLTEELNADTAIQLLKQIGWKSQ